MVIPLRRTGDASVLQWTAMVDEAPSGFLPANTPSVVRAAEASGWVVHLQGVSHAVVEAEGEDLSLITSTLWTWEARHLREQLRGHPSRLLVIDRMWVKESCRGTGLGKRLVRTMLREYPAAVAACIPWPTEGEHTAAATAKLRMYWASLGFAPAVADERF